MNELKSYYQKWQYGLIPAVIILWLIYYGIYSVIIKCIEGTNTTFIYNTAFSLVFEYIAPTTIVVYIYEKFLDYVNTKMWKKKFPQYDVSGTWNDITTYTRQFDKSGCKHINMRVPSDVIIEQTCLSIKVSVSVGKDFVWKSISANWDGDNMLNLLYEVEYYANLRETGYPPKCTGYERMAIDLNSMSESHKPLKMVGKFWHCVSEEGTTYMGDVVYDRSV